MRVPGIAVWPGRIAAGRISTVVVATYDTFATALDLAGVQASHGSACSSGSMTPPLVLTAIGLDETRARACVRFSFDWRNHAEDCAHVGAHVGTVMRRLRKKN